MLGVKLLSPDQLFSSIASLMDAVRGVSVNFSPTPISKFKTKYSGVLDGASEGAVQVITQGTKRFVLMSEEQVIALAANNKGQRSLGDIMREIEVLPHLEEASSVYTPASRVAQFRLPEAHAGK